MLQTDLTVYLDLNWISDLYSGEHIKVSAKKGVLVPSRQDAGEPDKRCNEFLTKLQKCLFWLILVFFKIIKNRAQSIRVGNIPKMHIVKV